MAHSPFPSYKRNHYHGTKPTWRVEGYLFRGFLSEKQSIKMPKSKVFPWVFSSNGFCQFPANKRHRPLIIKPNLAWDNNILYKNHWCDDKFINFRYKHTLSNSCVKWFEIRFLFSICNNGHKRCISGCNSLFLLRETFFSTEILANILWTLYAGYRFLLSGYKFSKAVYSHMRHRQCNLRYGGERFLHFLVWKRLKVTAKEIIEDRF